jgi:hypothetical protein
LPFKLILGKSLDAKKKKKKKNENGAIKFGKKPKLKTHFSLNPV